MHTHLQIRTQYTVLLVLLLMLLMPSAAHAVTIHNTVESSSYTGGRSVDGRDGADGLDGRDGEPGMDGADSGTPGASSVRVQTIINGEVVTDIHETGTNTATASSVYSDSSTLHDEHVTVHTSGATVASARDDTVGTPFTFGSLTSIRLMLITYVAQLI